MPLRTCVGCRTVRFQNELVRFVRTLKGSVVEDSTLRMSSRGAYLCLNTKERCLIIAIKKRAFEKALPKEV